METVLDTRKALHQLILTTTLRGKKPAETRFIDEQIKAQESSVGRGRATFQSRCVCQSPESVLFSEAEIVNCLPAHKSGSWAVKLTGAGGEVECSALQISLQDSTELS